MIDRYDWLFVVHNDTDPFVLKLIREGKRRIPDRMKVIYLYPSKHIASEPYYADSLIEPRLSIAENFRLFCERVLRLPKISRGNGFIPPGGLAFRKHLLRVVVHPTSSRETRNWPREKFVQLALHLREEGFQLVFVPGGRQGGVWRDLVDLGFELLEFETLDLLARYIYESGYLIGNDSGLGHLASALGIPTLTFSRKKTWAAMWAPSFAKGEVVTPSSWIPNIRGFRFRDRHWKRLISVGMARRAFERLVQRVDQSAGVGNT